jgi:hypothetical protein
LGGYGSGWQGSSAPTVESLRKRKLDLAGIERPRAPSGGRSDLAGLGACGAEVERPEVALLGQPIRVHQRARAVRLHTYTVRRPAPMAIVPEISRRCRILYRAQRFRCRKCYGLVYSSTRQTWSDRADTQANKLALKICGGDRTLCDGDEFPPKPKRMRWATYRGLEERFYHLKDLWAVGLIKRLGIGL